MNKKGFTLIELLAVIVILTVIALIATPIILNVIEKAKKGAAESSALGYIDAVEKTIAINAIDSNKTVIVDDSYTTDDLKTYGVTVKGEGPEDNNNSWVLIEKGRVKDYSLKIGDYIVNYDSTLKTAKVTTLTTPTKQPAGSVVKSGATKVQAQPGETHKGIIYLDPTDLSKVCDDTNSVSTTETKTGCMKWYIYDDSGDNYKLILDHNTTARIKWNDAGSNVAYQNSNIKLEIDKLVSDSNWVVTPDIISASEINKITGKTGWTNASEWHCMQTNKSDLGYDPYCNPATTMGWIFDHTYCVEGSNNWGCINNDKLTYGYYLKEVYSTPGNLVWSVYRRGNLGVSLANGTDIGIRPVIEIPKNNIKI